MYSRPLELNPEKCHRCDKLLNLCIAYVYLSLKHMCLVMASKVLPRL